MATPNQASMLISVVFMSLWDHRMGRNLVVVAYTPSVQNRGFHIYMHVFLQETLSSSSLKEREPLENAALYKGSY